MQEIEENIDGLWAAFEENSASFGPLVAPFATLVAEGSEKLAEGSAAFDAALAQAPDDECAQIMALTPKRPANGAALHAALQRIQAQGPIAEERAPPVTTPAPATDAPMHAPPESEPAAQPEAMDTDLPVATADDRAVDSVVITTEMDVEAAQPEATVEETAATETGVALVPARVVRGARTRGVRKKEKPFSTCYKEKKVKWIPCSPIEEAISANIVVELVDLRIVSPDHTTKTGKRNKTVTIEEAKDLTYVQLTAKQTIEARFKQRSVLAGVTREMNMVWQRVGDLMVAAKKLSPAYHAEMTDQGLGHLLDRPKRK